MMITKEQTALIYDSMSAPLFRYIVRFVPDTSAAEDILHDVFLRFIENSSRYSFTDGNPGPLLYKIARNRCLDYIKSRSKETADSDYIAVLPDPPPQHDAELIAEVERIISGLKPKYREAFNLRRDNDLTYPELAAQSGIPERTLKRRVAETIEIITSTLKKNGFLIFCFLYWHFFHTLSLYIWKV